jgi:hypothetical protein
VAAAPRLARSRLCHGRSGFGIVKTRPSNLYVAAVLILPISAYLAMTPRFELVALLAPLSLILAGLVLQQ